LSQLARGNRRGSGEDKPINILRTGRCITRALVVISTRGCGKNITGVHNSSKVDRLSAQVESALRRATIDSSKRITSTLITGLTEQIIHYAITA
jgi:hypothetical protein